jgi:hypothetical protein
MTTMEEDDELAEALEQIKLAKIVMRDTRTQISEMGQPERCYIRGVARDLARSLRNKLDEIGEQVRNDRRPPSPQEQKCIDELRELEQELSLLGSDAQ